MKTFRQPSILYYFIFWKPLDSPVFCIFCIFCCCKPWDSPVEPNCRSSLLVGLRDFSFSTEMFGHIGQISKKNWSLECILVRINIWAGSYLYASDVEPVREVNVPVSSSRGGRIPDTWIQNSEYLIREYRIQKTWYVNTEYRRPDTCNHLRTQIQNQ